MRGRIKVEDQKPYEVATKAETTSLMGIIEGLLARPEFDIGKLQSLLEMKERWEANQARKAYMEAMAAFKANPPEIEKDKSVAYGNTKYRHASLANVTDKINSALSQQGLSASWTTTQTDKGITVTCRISHILGHSEETSLTAPPDNSGAKNSIQALGSTLSYLQRYSLLSLTGLATHDMDTDGIVTEYITDEQAKEILEIIEKKGIDAGKFLVYLGVDTIGEIKKTDYEKSIKALKLAKGKAV
jgi:hypothetical protein